MTKKNKELKFKFASKKYPVFFDQSFREHLATLENIVIITDENIATVYANDFVNYRMLVISAGEEHKQQATVDKLIYDLINIKADKDILIIGIGGGVVTDIAGYVAAIYMRGVKCALMPTSILAMVDASVGGKNGVDAGIYKNLIGTIRQPEFLLFDFSFLDTLPQEEWVNGFAEIIKHACIKDADMFEELEQHSLEYYQSSKKALAALIKKNVKLKYEIVSNDETETGERKLLNFGHTIGHAIENLYHLPHGHAISIGMVASAAISEKLYGFSQAQSILITDVLTKYSLPVSFEIDKERVWQILIMDKKRSGDRMNFIVLKKIGDGRVESVALSDLRELFFNIFK